MRPITRGASAGAGLIFHVFAQDSASTTGAGKASVAYSSWSCRYIRNGETISGAITPEDISTLGTYAAPTANTNIRIKAVDNTNMIGVYEVQIHADWVNTTNSCQSLTIYLTASGVAVLPIQIPLIAVNQQDSVRFGLTALPNAAADAAGGLVISDAGGLDADAQRADVAAILVDTGTTLDAQLGAIAGFIDTEVSAIKTKTDFLPSATAGAAGGLMIAGSNAATTFASLTVTGATVHTGNVSMAAGLTITQSTVDGHGISITANGAGDGIRVFTDLVSGGYGLLISSFDSGLRVESAGARGAEFIGTTTGFYIGGDVGLSVTGAGGNSIEVSDAVSIIGAVVATNGSNSIHLGTNAITSAVIAASATSEIQSGLSTLDSAGIRSAVGMGSANLDAQLGAIAGFIDTEVSAIKTKTDFLPSATAGAAGGLMIAGSNAATTFASLTVTGAFTASHASNNVNLGTDAITATVVAASAIAEIQSGLSTLNAAAVNAEVDAALVDIHLDHLLAADYDPAAQPGVATALLNELIGNDGGVSRFTANALELAPSGSGSSPEVIAAAVWAEGTRTITGTEANAITEASLSAGVGTEIGGAVWSYTTRQLTVAQTFTLTGNIVGNVTGTVGSVAGSVASVAADGITSSSFAAGSITAAAIATNAIGAAELAASAVAKIQVGLSTLDAAGIRAAVGMAGADLDTQLSTLALEDTLAGVAAKTVNLPAAPAAVGDVPTAAQNVAAILAAAIESGVSLQQVLRAVLAIHTGKATNGDTTAITFKAPDGTTTRVVLNDCDTDGNRGISTFNL